MLPKKTARIFHNRVLAAWAQPKEISMLRELQNIILLRDWRKPTGGAEWSVGILGGVIALIGIILALGGAKLIGVGGSWYYLFGGLALIVAGLAVAQRKCSAPGSMPALSW